MDDAEQQARRDEDTAEGGALTEGLDGENEGDPGHEETAEGGALDDAETAGTEPARGHEAESS